MRDDVSKSVYFIGLFVYSWIQYTCQRLHTNTTYMREDVSTSVDVGLHLITLFVYIVIQYADQRLHMNTTYLGEDFSKSVDKRLHVDTLCMYICICIHFWNKTSFLIWIHVYIHIRICYKYVYTHKDFFCKRALELVALLWKRTSNLRYAINTFTHINKLSLPITHSLTLSHAHTREKEGKRER